MTDILKRVYNACDPYSPATPESYLDCAEVRGSAGLTDEFLGQLRLADDHLCFLFSGHIGCGKSSELAHLAHTLANPEGADERYFPILLDVSEYLDDYDVAPADILLSIVTEVGATLREQVDIELKDSYFAKRLNEVKEFFLSEVEIAEGELPLGQAKVKVRRLKKDPEARQKVRAALAPQMGTMLAEINTVFDEARLKLKKLKPGGGEQPYTDLVLILDNLEKIRRIAGKEEGLDSQREFFIERYTQLTGMAAHVIYTVPLRLVRSPDGPQLEQRYGPMFVLPMVKVIERGPRAAYEEGLDCMRCLLQKRLGDVALDDVFDAQALDFLLTYSGGHVRHLMVFVQNACAYADAAPVPLAAAHRAVQQTVRTYDSAMPETHWDKLAELDRSTDQKIPGGDDDYLVMLENLSVLEYINGGGQDVFALAEPWYAVNPIVRELQKFRAANERLHLVKQR